MAILTTSRAALDRAGRTVAVGPIASTSPPAGAPSSACRLGPACRLVGDLEANESVEIHGAFKGEVRAVGHTVVIAEEARVEATIEAARVSVEGHVRGSVTGHEHASLTQTANMVGKLATAEIRVEEGAIFRGQVDYTGSDRPPK